MSRKPHPIWDDEELLTRIASQSGSMSEMLSKLGRSTNSGNFQTLKGRCSKYKIALPVSRNKSNTGEATNAVKLSLEDIFSDRGIKVSGQKLRQLLITHFEVEDICSLCGQEPLWCGKPLVLETDHIDGNTFNNNVDNLRILCGHCHSQTKNFRGRNSRKGQYFYCTCGKKISWQSEHCRTCAAKIRHSQFIEKTSYPSLNILYREYTVCGSFEQLALKYSRSSNAVRKYIRSFGITLEDFRNGKLA